MPWHVTDKHPDCSGYAVVKDGTDDKVGCHKSKEEAEAQVKALYASEGDDERGNDMSRDVEIEEEGTEVTLRTGELVLSAEEAEEYRKFVPFKKEEDEDEESDEDEDEDEEEDKRSSEEPVEARICGVPASTVDVTDKAKKDHRNLPEPVAARLKENKTDVGIVDRAERGLYELRFRPEFRSNEDGTVSVHGYATVYGHRYDVLGGTSTSYGFYETIERGAAKRSVEQRDDVRLLVNHDGIALARTRSGTLRLESDDVGLYMEATLDVRNSPLAQSLFSAMQRGDMDEMSFAFKVLEEEWNDDYTDRSIREVMLYDVSIVTYPANPAALASLKGRSADTPEEKPEVEVEEEEAERDGIDLFTATAMLLDLDEMLDRE